MISDISYASYPYRVTQEFGLNSTPNIIEAWCCNQFGTRGKTWEIFGVRTFVFKREKDAMWFALKWSNNE
jgi:hypothetical protein